MGQNSADNTFLCPDEQAVARLAQVVAQHLVAPVTVAFSGDLGAGKTTFIRHLCEALGSAVPVASPTYVLSYEYPARSGVLIEHWDLYRVFDAVPELLEPPAAHTIRLIEWAERMAAWGDAPEITIALAFGSAADSVPTERAITISPASFGELVRKGLGS